MGKAATISMLEQSVVQVKIGMRISVMPGARIFRMVVIMFTPASRVPTPEICRAHR